MFDLSKKQANIGTRILVAIVVIVAASITLINVLTIFGVIQSPDLLTYAVLIGIYLLPFIIIAATVNKIIMEESESLQKRIDGPKEVGKKIELKINFKKGESIMADTSSHPAFYIKVAIASVLSVSLGASTLLIYPGVLTGGNLRNFLPILLPVLSICIVIHLFSKHIFNPYGWGEFVEHTWIALLAISISISILISLKTYILSTYPRQFWETFLGMPFSLPALLFLVMMLLVGGILIRFGDLYKFEGGPMKSSGITLVLVSLAFMIPQFEGIPWEMLLELISMAFSIALIGYGLVTGVMLYTDAGTRFLVTNQRVIKLNTNNLEKSTYYPLSNMKKVDVMQDFLAKTLGYGNVVMFFKTMDRYKSEKLYCIFYGIKNPHSLAKTIKAVASHKKKKKPISERKIKKKKKLPENGFYYKIIVPMLIGFMIFSSFTVPTTCAEEPMEYVRSEYVVTYTGSVSFTINGTFEIFSYEIEDHIIEAEQMRVLYHSNESDIIEEALVEEVSGLIDTFIKSTYNLSDDKGNITTEIELNEESLDPTLPSNEPIVLESNSMVKLNKEHFGLPEHANLEEIVLGILKLGGRFTNELELICKGGHEATYLFIAPDDLIFQNGNPSIEHHIDNTNETDSVRENLPLIISHFTPIDISESDPEVSLNFDVYELERKEEGEFLNMEFNLTASIKEMKIPNIMTGEIPENLELDYVNGALIRLFYQNGFEYPIHDLIYELENKMSRLVYTLGEVTYKSELEVFNLEKEYDIDRMDSSPAIEMYFNASIVRRLRGEEEELTAKIPTKYSVSEKVDIDVQNPTEWNLNFTVMVPEGIDLQRARFNGERLEIKSDGRDYIQSELEPGEEGTLSLDMGTEIDLMEFIPFAMMIGVLFVIWILLVTYKPKRRKI